MSVFAVEVVVTLRPVINDPQGISVQAGLHRLGFSEVAGVRVGKVIELQVEAPSDDVARDRVAAMCDRLLANPVLEDWRINGVRAVETAG